jgi:hypothetical protein
MAAGGGIAVVVPEQRAKVCFCVIGRHDEATVHVGVAAGFLTEQCSNGIDLDRVLSEDALLSDGCAPNWGQTVRHYAKGFSGRVIINRVNGAIDTRHIK